jgi:hypothetical protein
MAPAAPISTGTGTIRIDIGRIFLFDLCLAGGGMLAKAPVQSLVDHMHRCATVLDDMARLSCYDSLGSRQPAKGANAPAIPMGTK